MLNTWLENEGDAPLSLMSDIKQFAKTLKLAWLGPIFIVVILLLAAAFFADGSGDFSKPFGYRLF